LAGELIYQFGKLVNAVGSFGTAFGLVFDVAKEAFLNIGKVGQGIYHVLAGVAQGIAADFVRAFAVIGDKWDQLTAAMAKTWNSIAESSFGQTIGLGTMEGSSAGENLRSEADRLEAAGVANIKIGGGLLDTAVPSLQKIKDLLASIKDEKITLPDLLSVASDDGGAGGEGGRAAQPDSIGALAQSLMTERELLENWRSESMTKLQDFNALELDALGGHAEAKLRIEEEYRERLARLRQDEQNTALTGYAQLFGNLATVFKAGGDKMVGITKAFSIAQGLLNSYRAYTEILADPALIGRPFLRQALAASALASGVAQVAAMRSVSTSGGGGAPSAAATSSAPALPTQTVAINLQGDTFSRSSVEGLLEQIQSQLDRGGRLVFS
jgi:hypothetical protein